MGKAEPKWNAEERELLEAAKKLNKEGLFWVKEFNKAKKYKNPDTGYDTIIRQDKSGNLRLVREKKYEGRMNRMLDEEIPPQINKILKELSVLGFIDESKNVKDFSKQVNRSLREAFTDSKLATASTGVVVEGGHLLAVSGKGRGTELPPHEGRSIINEPREPYLNKDGIRLPGNNEKKNDPGWHFSRAQLEEAGLSPTWADILNRYLTGTTGSLVENISKEDLRKVRDKEASIGQVVAQRDRSNQIEAQEIEERRAYDLETEKGQQALTRQQKIDPRTGLLKGLKNQIMKIIPGAQLVQESGYAVSDIKEAINNPSPLSVANATLSSLQAAGEVGELIPNPKVKAVSRAASWPLGFVQDRMNETFNPELLKQRKEDVAIDKLHRGTPTITKTKPTTSIVQDVSNSFQKYLQWRERRAEGVEAYENFKSNQEIYDTLIEPLNPKF